MDRKRYKKIKRYLGVYIAFALLFTVFLYAQVSFERSAEQRRMLILVVRHPELEGEIAALWDGAEESHIRDSEDQETEEGGERTIRDGYQESGVNKEGTAKDDYQGNEVETGWDLSVEMLRLAEEGMEEKYGHTVKCVLPQKAFFLFWGTGMLVGGALTALLGCWEKYGRYGERETEKTYRELSECLEQFQSGNFRQFPDDMGSSEEQLQLWERMRELGIYFEGLKERLKEEENSTKTLITDISHQLKTPLASLRMSHELVTAGNVTEEEKKEFQEQETREIEKLEMLLAELVNLSRLEKRVIQLHPVPSSLRNTIAGAVNQIYMKARKNKVEIQVEMEEDLEICHDRKWTEEAIVNVLDNAVKYSEENTTVTVRVQLLVSNVLIEIADEGMGIRPEELAKIYQRFYRGQGAREKVKEGAGVGLYLARMILERQGGTISARRRPKRGTVFKITLPAPQASQSIQPL